MAKQPLIEALTGINKRLDNKGLVAFDVRSDADRTKAIARTIAVSLDLLDQASRVRFSEMGIFPEDADVPLGIVSRLWAETGELDYEETEDLASYLYSLSLLLSLDLDRRTLRLHDTVRNFLQAQAGRDGLIAQHKRLINSMAVIGTTEASPAAEKRYFYLHLPQHLSGSGQLERLEELLLDPGWINAKLKITGSPQGLVTDYEQYGRGQFQELIARTLRLTTGIYARDYRQLLPQLLSRLEGGVDEVGRDFLVKARRLVSPPAILD